MRTYLRQLRRSRVMRRSRVIFDRQRPSVVDLRCPPAAVGRSEALCTNRPYSVDLRSALKQTRRSRVVLGASQICADLGSCGTAAPGNADFGSSPVSMRRFRGSPSAGAEQRRSGVSFARRADLGSFLRICADPGFIPILYIPGHRSDYRAAMHAASQPSPRRQGRAAGPVSAQLARLSHRNPVCLRQLSPGKAVKS